MNDLEFSEEENDFSRSVEDGELITNLLSENIDDEDALFTLVERELIPQMILRKDLVQDCRFDYIRGLLNVYRRLLQMHDDVVDQWLGIVTPDNGGGVSIFSFMFEIINQYYDRLCLSEIIEFQSSDDVLCFSLYDYTCSIMCAFVMTLKDEQLNVVEEILFENLLSSCLISALLASDIICFMCRTCNSNFIFDICNLIFSLLIELYVEDVEIKDIEKNASAYENCQMTQEVLLQLLNRLLTFLSEEEKELIKQNFPEENCLFVWKRITSIETFTVELSENEEVYLPYDKIYLATQSPTTCCQIISSIVDNFLQTNNQYHSLFYLRLLARASARLPFPGNLVGQTFDKMKQVLEVSKSLHHHHLLLNILRTLNSISTTCDSAFQNEKITSPLVDLLLILYEKCNKNLIAKQYFLVVLQNLLSNSIFTSIVHSISGHPKWRKEFRLYLKHSMKGRFMASEERELYVAQLEKLYRSVLEREKHSTLVPFTDVEPVKFENSNSSKRSTESPDHCNNHKRVKNNIEDESL